MTRSNKKKSKPKNTYSAFPILDPVPAMRPPSSVPGTSLRATAQSDVAVAKLFEKEKNMMIGRSIASAQKHGIRHKKD